MEYQRVTEILEPFTGIKYISEVVLENAAVRGTKVHSICEDIIRGNESWAIPEEYQGYVKSFLQWWDKRYDVLACEKRFFCDELFITGKIDVIAKIDGLLTLIDLKTSAQESRSWMLQGTAYSYMAKKSGYPIKQILFIRLNRGGNEPKYHIYEENMSLFKECLNVYRYFYGRKSKKKIDTNT